MRSIVPQLVLGDAMHTRKTICDLRVLSEEHKSMSSARENQAYFRELEPLVFTDERRFDRARLGGHMADTRRRALFFARMLLTILRRIMSISCPSHNSTSRPTRINGRRRSAGRGYGPQWHRGGGRVGI